MIFQYIVFGLFAYLRCSITDFSSSHLALQASTPPNRASCVATRTYTSRYTFKCYHTTHMLTHTNTTLLPLTYVFRMIDRCVRNPTSMNVGVRNTFLKLSLSSLSQIALRIDVLLWCWFWFMCGRLKSDAFRVHITSEMIRGICADDNADDGQWVKNMRSVEGKEA